jgi:shikimate kinase
LPLIALVGLPGSGKTTVGRQISRALGLRFIDTDAEIERRAGRPITSLFEIEGESHFRDLEQAVLAELTGEQDAVLSTGGGAILRAANRENLRNRTTVIYLRTRPETLMRRLRNDKRRPLLQTANPLLKLRELHAAREPLYRETAHFVIDCERPSVSTLVNRVLMQIELAGLAGPAASVSPSPSGTSED